MSGFLVALSGCADFLCPAAPVCYEMLKCDKSDGTTSVVIVTNDMSAETPGDVFYSDPDGGGDGFFYKYISGAICDGSEVFLVDLEAAQPQTVRVLSPCDDGGFPGGVCNIVVTIEASDGFTINIGDVISSPAFDLACGPLACVQVTEAPVFDPPDVTIFCYQLWDDCVTCDGGDPEECVLAIPCGGGPPTLINAAFVGGPAFALIGSVWETIDACGGGSGGLWEIIDNTPFACDMPQCLSLDFEVGGCP